MCKSWGLTLIGWAAETVSWQLAEVELMVVQKEEQMGVKEHGMMKKGRSLEVVVGGEGPQLENAVLPPVLQLAWLDFGERHL